MAEPQFLVDTTKVYVPKSSKSGFWITIEKSLPIDTPSLKTSVFRMSDPLNIGQKRKSTCMFIDDETVMFCPHVTLTMFGGNICGGSNGGDICGTPKEA